MKKSKILMLSLFLVMILAVSAVSAAEDISDSSLQSVDDDAVDVLSSSGADVLGTREVKNFTYLKDMIGDDDRTVDLGDFDYTFDAVDDASLVNGIEIKHNVVINGNDNVISGNDAARIFNVASTGSLTLNNVTLTNGNHTEGAVYVGGGALNADYVTFTDCLSDNGALYSKGGNVNINHSKFFNNDVLTRQYMVTTIYLENGGSAIINNSVFAGNPKIKANRTNGDYLYDVASYTCNLEVYNSNFTNNTATHGVLVFYSCSGKVDNCRFINNTGYSGGAIDITYGATVDINNSYFEDNEVGDYGSPAHTSAGGAIAITTNGYSAAVNIKGCTFKHNGVSFGETPHGGAISIQQSKVNIDSCIFEDNKAAIAGGAVYLDRCMVTVTESSFINNSAIDGGAIYLATNQDSLTVTNSNFTENIATLGNAIYNKGTFTIQNSNFKFVTGTINAEDIIYGDSLLINGTLNVGIYNATSKTMNLLLNDVKKDTITLDDNNKFNSTITDLAAGTYAISFNDDNGNKFILGTGITNETLTVKVNKAILTPTVTVDSTIAYGDPIWVNVTVPDDYDGAMKVFVDNEYVADVVVPSMTIDQLTRGKHNITVTFTDGTNYTGTTVNKEITITQSILTPTVVVAESLVYGEAILVNVTVPSDYTGAMEIYVDNEDKGAVTTPSMTISQLAVGKHNITVTFAADDNYTAADNITKELTITQAALNPTVVLADSIAYGEAILLTVTVPSDYTGNMSLYVDGAYYSAVSTPSMTIGQLALGKHNVTITFAADGNYAAAADYNKNFTIIPGALNPTVVVDDSIVYGDDIWINITVPSDYTGDMNLYVDGDDYGAALTPSMTIYQLPAGKHNVTITFAADGNYAATVFNKNFTITPAALNPSVVVADSTAYGDEIWINVTVPSDYTGNMNYYVDGDDYGAVSTPSMTIYQLPVGKHNATINFAADNNYFATEVIKEFYITKVAPTLDVTIDDITTLDNALTVKSSVDGNYDMEIGINVVSFTVENGIAMVPIVKLTSGDKIAGVLFRGNENYTEEYVYVNFTVNKVDSKIASANVNVVYLNNGKITINLTGADNAPIEGDVVVVLNKIEYNATTNADGIATVTIAANLVPNTYKFTAKFNGDDVYNPASKAYNFVVKKATPKFTAKNKAFKTTTSPKKYAVILKAGKNVVKKAKVTLRVGGVTYTATTNANGKATFKITKLSKKGSYTAAIKFQGNDCFNKAYKKVKITTK